MLDRGIIKWQPFNSCFDSNQIINDITAKRQRVNFPTLCDDQINTLSDKTINAYNLKINITVMFYYAGNIKELTGKITYLNSNKKELYLNNTKIYFNQIIQIKELNF